MSLEANQSKFTVEDIVARFARRDDSLSSKFSYFATLPIAEEDLRQYLHDPIAAISPAIIDGCPA